MKIFLRKALFFFFKKKTYLISSNFELKNILNLLKEKNIFGIDTEFEWRNTYYPILSVIQISTKDEIILIDCIKCKDLSGLAKLLVNPKRLLIFHSSRSDATVLSKCAGIKCENVFDLQIAENILSDSSQIGYASIVKKYFGRHLDKSETNSNWLHRPLTEKQIKYAQDDVLFLIEIYKIQSKRLKKYNLLDECFERSRKEASLGNDELVVARLKKLKKFNKLEKKIFLWRENLAIEKNIPPSYVFKDKSLKSISNCIVEKKDFYYLDNLIKNEEYTSKLIEELLN